MTSDAEKRAGLRTLDWDTRHFQFQVAELVGPDLDDRELTEALAEARQEGVRLVYWSASPARQPARELLAEFHGRLVDRKATYALDLDSHPPAGIEHEVRVVMQPRGPAPPDLLALGVAAGAFSRFRRDPWIPRQAFSRLYEVWMERSTRGELAEAVLVALPERDDRPILGVLTIGVHRREARIGLVAVGSAARGRGIASTLVAAAHNWMVTNGLVRSKVVTQQDNEVACRLYERACYTLVDLVHLYHFWPLGPAAEREPGARPEP
jgi:ribosomal protein S18 acetylase RimI-like enzyme